jgi:acyl-CoA thioester hydrolase
MKIKEPESKYRVRFADCDPIGHLSNLRYFDYMLNAREDHCLDNYQLDNFEQSKKTGCLWVVLQNQIAYIKEVRYNKDIIITSKIIKYTDRTNTIEVLMLNKDKTLTHAALWVTFIYFNLTTRKSEIQPQNFMDLFQEICVNIPENLFEERVASLRKQNKKII